jgi:serine/threonine protein kinase
MPEIEDLADILVGCRVASRDRWERAALAGGGDLARTLDALADGPPDWWDGTPPAPPGLTTYQRSAIELRFEADELDRLHRDLALNRFLLLEKLGQGGQGEVYRGRQLNPPRYAAVKTLIRETEVRRRRFEQEARTMMRVQHPAVARFYLYERVRDADGVPTDEYLIAMEFVDGTPLHRLVRRAGPVPWPFAVRWTADLLGGLAVIHETGLVHRDVKPENVMVVGPAPGPGVAPQATAVKLLDFGAVKRADVDVGDGVTAAKVFIGTVEYAPPEQWVSESVAASDLYALGGTLFFMLTGRTPFQKDRRDPAAYREAHLTDDPPDLRQYAPDAPAGLDRLFQRMMAKDPAARGTAAELLGEFRRLPRAPTASAPSPAAARPRPAPRPTPPAPAGRGPEPRPPLDRAAGPVVAVLERVFLPAHHRPAAGEEPPLAERLVALLRRPLVLLLLIVAVLALLVVLIK